MSSRGKDVTPPRGNSFGFAGLTGPARSRAGSLGRVFALTTIEPQNLCRKRIEAVVRLAQPRRKHDDQENLVVLHPAGAPKGARGIIHFRPGRFNSRYDVTIEKWGPRFRSNGRRGSELSTTDVKALALVPSDAKASRIALAECSAALAVVARAKTVEPEPLIAKPVAPASSAAFLAPAYPWRIRDRAGSANRSSRQRP